MIGSKADADHGQLHSSQIKLSNFTRDGRLGQSNIRSNYEYDTRVSGATSLLRHTVIGVLDLLVRRAFSLSARVRGTFSLS
jgi:hypothetical protein